MPFVPDLRRRAAHWFLAAAIVPVTLLVVWISLTAVSKYWPGHSAQSDAKARGVTGKVAVVPTDPTLPPLLPPLCIPADFERTGTLLVGSNELIKYHPATFTQYFEALAGSNTRNLMALITSDAEQAQGVELLESAPWVADRVRFFQVPMNGMWIRDFGPIIARMPGGRHVLLHSQYNITNRTEDAKLAGALGKAWNLPVVEVPLTIEGGNLLSNGKGIIITSRALYSRNMERGYDKKAIEDVFRNYFGCEQWVSLRALPNEPTGHVDTFVTLTAANVAVVAQVSPVEDPLTAAFLNEAADLLQTLTTPLGPMKVHRIQLPRQTKNIWRTYTNVVFANGTLLVPTYPDYSPELDQKALELYAQLLPSWKIVPVDASTLVQKGGELHCITINVPLGVDVQ